ncbi:ATP-dependent DNA helicase [Candidatus Nitrosopelagicus sp.]|nr:ATP-dependent DNA helicase [Candidatus Nitrosopelagicus sp.]
MSSQSTILKSFPKEFAPRPLQEKLIEEIQEKIDSGVRVVLLSAPTGIGKSLIAASVAGYFGSSFVVTASKHLQDQYTKDMPWFKPNKGMPNFACHKMMEKHGIDLTETDFAVQNKWTCDMGTCFDKKTKKECKYKPKLAEVAEGKRKSDDCLYYLQKYQSLISSHSIWNYASYFQMMKYQKEKYAQYLNKKVAIFDEAHRIEDQIIQFVGIDIYERNLNECKIDVESYDLENIDDVMKLSDGLSESYARQISNLEDSSAFAQNPDYEVVQTLENKYKKYAEARSEIYSNKQNFILNKPYFDEGGKFRSLSVKPLDISKYVSTFFEHPVQIFMSATIDKESFCENTGFDPGIVEIVDTQVSPFPIENRKVEFTDVKRLSYNSTRDDELLVIKKIDEIMTKYSDKKGLVLTSSKSRCFEILQNLSEVNKKRIRICHSFNSDGKTQDQVVQEHAESENGVLLSSSLWEGVDLKEDLSRFQIVAKAPYPMLSETRTKIKMQKYPLWYKAQAIMKLLQGFGRSIRDYGDWADTYVLDSAAHELLLMNRKMVPHAYHDIIFPSSFKEFLGDN